MGQLNLDSEGTGTPLQYSCLENPMDGGAWQATVHGSQSRTRLSDIIQFMLLSLAIHILTQMTQIG